MERIRQKKTRIRNIREETKKKKRIFNSISFIYTKTKTNEIIFVFSLFKTIMERILVVANVQINKINVTTENKTSTTAIAISSSSSSSWARITNT